MRYPPFCCMMTKLRKTIDSVFDTNDTRLAGMESIEKFIELLEKRQVVREEQFKDEERKQMTEYSDLMNTLQIIKDERNNYKENISKNLQRLTQHKHSIYKLIHNSENIASLPVSHDYHRQAITFLSDGIDFINKLQNVYKNFDNNKMERNISSTDMIHNITSCTNSIGSELYKIKSLITEVNTLQNNTNILQEYCLANDEEMDG